MTVADPKEFLHDLSQELEAARPGVVTTLMEFPAGGAMLDVHCGGRMFVLARTADGQFGVDEVHANDGFEQGYGFVTFDPVAAVAKIESLVSEVAATTGPAWLSLLVVYTNNLDALADFYRGLGLNLSPEKHGSGPRHFSCRLGPTVLELFPAINNPSVPPSTRFGLAVESVDLIVSRVDTLGGQVISAPSDSRWGRRAVIADPDGNRVELNEITGRRSPFVEVESHVSA
jgi:lactoylglutathione lyase